MSFSPYPWIFNFANSIVGVGVLAIPFCFHKCGILLTAFLILATNYLAKATCNFLLKASQKQRVSGIETLSLVTVGPIGKLVAELSTIGLLLGTLVAFQVVLGDLAPTIVHNVFGVEESWNLRAALMCLSCMAIIPLTLMRNVSSLAGMNAMSMGFYSFFVLLIGALSLKNLLSQHWWSQVHFWQPAGFFHCLPIISLAFSCQTQVFVMYDALPEPSVNVMNGIIDKAINLVTFIYISVGFLGYVAFYDVGIRGDILANFPSGLMTDGIKAGFWLSVVISFPLMLFPARLAIYSLLFRKSKSSDVIASAGDYIPPPHFIGITLSLVGGTLIVGITIPHIETVLSVTGACIGTFLCFVLPSALYLATTDTDDRTKRIAQIILLISLLNMVASTVTVLSGTQSHEPSGEIYATKPPTIEERFEKDANQLRAPFHSVEKLNVAGMKKIKFKQMTSKEAISELQKTQGDKPGSEKSITKLIKQSTPRPVTSVTTNAVHGKDRKRKSPDGKSIPVSSMPPLEQHNPEHLGGLLKRHLTNISKVMKVLNNEQSEDGIPSTFKVRKIKTVNSVQNESSLLGQGSTKAKSNSVRENVALPVLKNEKVSGNGFNSLHQVKTLPMLWKKKDWNSNRLNVGKKKAVKSN